MSLPVILLKPKREYPFLKRHPILLSGAIQKIYGDPQEGDIVLVLDHKENFLGYGFYEKGESIVLKFCDFDEDSLMEKDFTLWLVKRLERALSYRKKIGLYSLIHPFRWVFSEADLLPGLLIDVYPPYVIFQRNAWIWERKEKEFLEAIRHFSFFEGFQEKIDYTQRKKRNLPLKEGLSSSKKVPSSFSLKSRGGIFMEVDLPSSHKTGWYLDQQENWKEVRNWAKDKVFLDLFSYQGAFSLHALFYSAKEAHVVESSSSHLKILEKSIQHFYPEWKKKIFFYPIKVLPMLNKWQEEKKKFSFIVLDPPKLSPSYKHKEKALKMYHLLNEKALDLLEEGGIFFTFSCSQAISFQDLYQILQSISFQKKFSLRFVKLLTQSPDHPVPVSYPEAFYLKGYVIIKEG